MGNIQTPENIPPGSVQVGPHYILYLDLVTPFDGYAVVITNKSKEMLVNCIYNSESIANQHKSILSTLDDYKAMTIQVIKIDKMVNLDQITTVLGKKPVAIMQVDGQPPHVLTVLCAFIF